MGSVRVNQEAGTLSHIQRHKAEDEMEEARYRQCACCVHQPWLHQTGCRGCTWRWGRR